MKSEKIKAGDKIITPILDNADLYQELKKNWSSNFSYESKEFSLITQPFKVCKIKNFLQEPLGTYDLRGELCSVYNKKRSNDLMKLEESVCDLQDVTAELTHSRNIECIKQFCSEMIKDLRPWLSKVTNIELNNTMSIRTSTYTDTDFLLCHNDQIEDRRIAFILYLSKNWTEDCGGHLNLFNNENGVPSKIEQSLLPEYNSLLFFEVSNNSFHSVSEILKNTRRFSVNGWFHGTVDIPSPLPRSIKPLNFISPSNNTFDWSPFIDDSRVCNKTFIEIINSIIEKRSFCGIKNYIKKKQYNDLLNQISSDQIKWLPTGPPDQRNYEVADSTTLPDNLKTFCNIFQNTFFCRLLNSYTDLELVPDDSKNPKMVVELQRWHQGCYTILHDGYIKNKESNEEEDEEEIIDFKESEDEEEAKEKLNKQENTSEKYTVKDMLQDIIVDSAEAMEILPPTLSVAVDEDEKDNYSVPQKRRRIEIEENIDKTSTKSQAESIGQGTLDVVMYFHANNAPPDTTLNYVDPGKEDGVILTVPIEDNSLFLIYRQEGIVRHNEYVNHYCKGYFYSLVCNYIE